VSWSGPEDHPDEAGRWEEREEEIEVTDPYGDQDDDWDDGDDDDDW